MKWYLNVVLFCISLTISDVEHASPCLLDFSLLWRNVYLCLPPIFLSGLFVLVFFFFLFCSEFLCMSYLKKRKKGSDFTSVTQHRLRSFSFGLGCSFVCEVKVKRLS